MPMVVMLFLTMVVMTGMGVDFMRHEAARADLQNALDRGVLAATARTQTLAQREVGMSDAELEAAKEELIRSYMRARTFSQEEPELDINIPDGLADFETAVEASARYDLDTFFLKVAGFTEMGVPATSYAEQRRLDIEVALVLDVSNSMRNASAVADPDNPSGSNLTKMDAMKLAAKDFLAGLLDDQVEGQTLVSVVPYTSSASANAFMANQMGLQPVTNFLSTHNYSYCFEFETDGDNDDGTVTSNPDYLTVPIDRGAGYQHRQMQHFSNINEYYADLYWGGESRYDCPVASNRILPFSNDLDDLEDMIDGMALENWTATYSGVKWGAALLDPSSRSLVQAMVDEEAPTDPRSDAVLGSDYSGWPNAYEDTGAHKYLIIMSDGRNSKARRVASDDAYYTPTIGATEAELKAEQAERLQEWDEGWAWEDLPSTTTVVDTTEGDELNMMICDALKDASGGGNLTIFTIGYDISDSTTSGQAALAVLQYCATNSETDFFNITGGDDPATAFEEIRARLSLLKLAQSRY